MSDLFLDLDLSMRMRSTDCDYDHRRGADADTDLLCVVFLLLFSVLDLLLAEFTLLDGFLLRARRTGDLKRRGCSGICGLIDLGRSYFPWLFLAVARESLECELSRDT